MTDYKGKMENYIEELNKDFETGIDPRDAYKGSDEDAHRLAQTAHHKAMEQYGREEHGKKCREAESSGRPTLVKTQVGSSEFTTLVDPNKGR